MDQATATAVFNSALEINKELLDRLYRRGRGIAYCLEELYSSWNGDSSKQPDGFVIAEVEQHGGEGQGEEYWVVYSVTETATGAVTYVKFDAFYESHNGHEYNDPDNFEIVEQREVVVKQWFTV